MAVHRIKIILVDKNGYRIATNEFGADMFVDVEVIEYIGRHYVFDRHMDSGITAIFRETKKVTLTQDEMKY
jgi:hypothetical protein